MSDELVNVIHLKGQQQPTCGTFTITFDGITSEALPYDADQAAISRVTNGLLEEAAQKKKRRPSFWRRFVMMLRHLHRA